MLEVHQLGMTAWQWLGITSPNFPASEASFRLELKYPQVRSCGVFTSIFCKLKTKYCNGRMPGKAVPFFTSSRNVEKQFKKPQEK